MPRRFLSASTADNPWWAAWHFDPGLVLLLLTAATAYVLLYRAALRAGRRVPPRWQALAYLAGLASLALALLGPPDYFGAMLFSAHMVQHLLLTLVAAPLLVLGRPAQVALRGMRPRYRRAVLRCALGRPAVRGALAMLTHPLSVVLLTNGSLVVWHLPGLYEAALQSRPLHELEHACFFGTALLFWWVLVEPVPRHHRLSPTAALLVVFTTWIVGDLLGATLTLTKAPLYPRYAELPKPWPVSPLDDQHLGGLIMWLGGGAFYVAVLLGMLVYPHVRQRRRPGPCAGTRLPPVL